MAKRLNYEIGFTADTTELKKAVDDAVVSLQRLGTSGNGVLTGELKQASKEATELSRILKGAIDVETGKLDLTKFNLDLKKSGKSISQYGSELKKLGLEGEKAFISVANAILKAEMPLKRTNKLMNELWTTMKNTLRWQLTSSVLHGFMGALQTAYGYSQDLDKSLTNIRIVSEESSASMKQFAEYASKAAKNLSTTTTAYTDAALIFYQQGKAYLLQ